MNTSTGSIPIVKVVNPSEGFHDSVDPTNSRTIYAPIPLTASPDPMNDGHNIIFDTATKYFYEFSRFKRINSTYAEATKFDYFHYTGLGTALPFNGARWWQKGVRGSGAPFIGGLITMDEFLAGEIKHALAMTAPTNRKKSSNSVSWNWELCSPIAGRTDGHLIDPNGFLEGQRVQLNPNFNINSFGPKAKMIAQALKTHGAYIVDNGPNFSIFFQNLGGSATSSPWYSYGSDISSLSTIPLDQFRVLDCSSNMSTK
eukprot:gene9393-11538_t